MLLVLLFIKRQKFTIYQSLSYLAVGLKDCLFEKKAHGNLQHLKHLQFLKALLVKKTIGWFLWPKNTGVVCFHIGLFRRP